MLLTYESNKVLWSYLIVLHSKSLDYYDSSWFELSLEKCDMQLQNESLLRKKVYCILLMFIIPAYLSEYFLPIFSVFSFLTHISKKHGSRKVLNCLFIQKFNKKNGEQSQNAIKKKISSGNLTSMMCNQFFCNFAVNVALSLWKFI